MQSLISHGNVQAGPQDTRHALLKVPHGEFVKDGVEEKLEAEGLAGQRC